jgi:hypothetical protein
MPRASAIFVHASANCRISRGKFLWYRRHLVFSHEYDSGEREYPGGIIPTARDANYMSRRSAEIIRIHVSRTRINPTIVKF